MQEFALLGCAQKHCRHSTIGVCFQDGVALAFRDNETQAFGASYGSFCAAWEDGKCGADNDETGGHSCGSSKTCSDMWPTFNFNINQPWCCDSWCYVNRTTCTDEKVCGVCMLVMQ